MRLIVAILLFGVSVFGNTCFAALSYVDKSYIPNDNRLINPGFENGKAYWTASNFTMSTTVPIKGLQMGVWNASASSQTLASQSVAIKAGRVEGYCKIQVPSGTATHTLEIYDGSSVLASATIRSSTSAKYTSVKTLLGSDDDLILRLSSNSDEVSINIDDCYLGPEIQFAGVEAANINCDAGSVITSEIGSWVSSVGNISGGACAITLSAGIFSAAPLCTATPNAAFASVGLMLSAASSSSTALSVDCEDDASGACTSVDFNITCIGPR